MLRLVIKNLFYTLFFSYIIEKTLHRLVSPLSSDTSIIKDKCKDVFCNLKTPIFTGDMTSGLFLENISKSTVHWKADQGKHFQVFPG